MDDLVLEEWRWIPGYEGRYAVSNRGRVYSYPHTREQLSRSGKLHKQSYDGKYLRPGRKNTGHLNVMLGRSVNKDVHVLVMIAFVGPCPEGQEVRHLNDIPDDNRWPENLTYGTRSQNMLDKKHNGKQMWLSAIEAKEAKVWVRMGMKRTDVAKLFGVPSYVIYNMTSGKAHADIE